MLGDPAKRTVAAQILGQAYVTAHNLAIVNRAGIETIADALEDRREIMGDELLRLLESAEIRIPELDLADEAVWPPLEFSAAIGRGPQQHGPAGGDPDVSEATTESAGNGSGFIEAEPAKPVGEPERASRTDRARSAAYRSRFVIVYVALGLVAAVSGSAPSSSWSSAPIHPRPQSGRRGSRRAATPPRPGRSPTGWRRRYRLEERAAARRRARQPAEGDAARTETCP